MSVLSQTPIRILMCILFIGQCSFPMLTQEVIFVVVNVAKIFISDVIFLKS
jgi:hypothetical protein